MKSISICNGYIFKLIDHNSLRSEGAKCIGVGLKENKTLASFCISFILNPINFLGENSIHDSGICELVKGIIDNTSIKTWIFSCTK